jgi:glycosyltransferase involved in cell wall biosynthesis
MVPMRRTAVFFVPYTIIGGSHHSLLGLIEGLGPGWRAVAVYTEHTPAFNELYESRGVECVHLDAPGILHADRPGNPLRLLRDVVRTVRGLRRILRKLRADLIYGESLNGRLLAGLAAAGLPTAALGYIRKCRNYGLLDRLAFRLCDAYVVISDEVLRSTTPWAVLQPQKVFKIYNGVWLDRFVPGPGDPALKEELGVQGHPTVGYFGRFAPFKCVDVLLQSLALLRERGHTDVRLLLVGAPQERAYPGYAAKLGGIITREGLEEAVVRTGYVADVRPYVRAVDVVAVPSDREPFGRAVIEAMALERPVVGGNNGGIPEIAADGEDALLVEPRNAVALADALERLLTDEALARRLAEAGRRTVERRFDMRLNQKKLRALLELLVRRRTRRPA